MRQRTGSRVAAAGLVAGNAVPLVGVLAFGWSVGSLLLVYWLESAVVGASFYAKILRAGGTDDPAALPDVRFNDRSVSSFVGASNREIAGFFRSHYGWFWAIHGMFVGVMVFLPTAGGVDPVAVATSFVGLAGYHAVSFHRHVVVDGELARRGPVSLMVEPYRRVLVLHLTVVFGMFGVMTAGAPAALVAVMVVVKTALDFRGHWREHEDAADRSSGSAVTDGAD